MICRASSTDQNRTIQGFANRDLDEFVMCIMGDLHLAPEQMHLFNSAREQMVEVMSKPNGELHEGARVVQLGDLGHGKHKSGSTSCFQYAKQYMDGFRAPFGMILGNHDLEGDEFDTDEHNLAAWQAVFGQHHHWVEEVGPAVALGLSTTRYRSNANSHHEVYVDDEQMAWLEEQLQRYRERPIIIFTHAPPMGCGLRVLQNVHIKNRCAWLNHSDRPERFINLVSRFPNIKLWFSGHFHLSHNYPDSISTVGGTAFVQVGVIGECNRDGNRQSRVLKADRKGYRLYTLDHETARLRLDASHSWSDSAAPLVQLPPDEELLCDPSAGWLCSKLDCTLGEDSEFVQWFPVGRRTILALHDDLLVEYDLATSSPTGLLGKVALDAVVKLLDASGQPATATDGSDVATVVAYDSKTGESQLFPRNEDGCFYKVYQPNKWRIKKMKQEVAAAAAAVEVEVEVAAVSRV